MATTVFKRKAGPGRPKIMRGDKEENRIPVEKSGPVADPVVAPAAAAAPSEELPSGSDAVLMPGIGRENEAEEEECENPIFKRYYSDHVNHSARTNRLWEWWKALPDKYKNKITAYVYRSYPPLLDPDKGPKYIDVVTVPFETDQAISDRYGAGDYKIFVNIYSKKQRTLAECYVKGSRDFKSQPPSDSRITEVDEKTGRPKWIDPADPQCKSYIEFLRTRGLMPEAWQQQKEAEMEQQADVLKTVLGMQRELIDKATNRRDDGSRPLEETVGRVIDTAMQGAKAGQEILKDTIKTLQDQINRPNNTPSSTDALQVALQIAEMINKQSDPTPYMAMITELNKTVAQMQDRTVALQMERLNDKVEQLRNAQQPSGPASDLSKLIEDFRRIQDLVGGEGGGGPKLPGWISAVQVMAEPIARIVGNLTQAYLVSRMPQGVGIPMPPVTPQPAAPAPPSGPMSNVSPEAFAPAPQVAQPYRDPRLYPNQMEVQQPPQQAPPQFQQPQQDPHMLLLVSIAPALLNQLRDGLGGDDLADWLIGGYGEGVYRDLIDRAKQTGLPAHQALLLLIDSYPPLAQELAKEARPEVERFVKQFSEFDGEEYDRKRGRAESAEASA